MRIRHVVCVTPSAGGMGKAALTWVEALQERGHDVELVVPQIHGQVSTHPLVRSWPTWLAWGNGAILRAQADLWKDTDLVHLHVPFYGTEEGLLLRKPPKPCVVTFHMDAVQTGLLGAAIKLHQQFVQPFLLKRADRIIASSLDYVRSSSAASLARLHPEQWEELPFFVDETVFKPSEHSTSPNLRALFVSVLDRAHLFKGLPLIFEALKHLPRIQLTIVGDGDQRSFFERLAHTEGISSQVTFRGRLTSVELIDAYQQADVLLSPSTSAAEAFGLAALEAQACGTPVIASALPGVRTVVRGGETGLLISPGSLPEFIQALTRMQEDSGLRERLGQQARRHVEASFTRTKIVDRLELVYRDVCASR